MKDRTIGYITIILVACLLLYSCDKRTKYNAMKTDYEKLQYRYDNVEAQMLLLRSLLSQSIIVKTNVHE